MPRWAIWISNLVVVAVLAGLAYSLKWAGWQFALGLTVGFFACYVIYKCWRQDAETDKHPHFTD